ncbi:MAG: hypothetical protein ICV60_03895 [Pyrinomonadaceae bacterium]|nr:hypothetical protein [Pyrinomonadaceae bacterium]
MSRDELEYEPKALPIACTLTDAGEIESRRASIEAVFAGVTEKRELADGYELLFPGDDDYARRLMQFVEAERKCCPFFIFELVFEQSSGPIHLRLRGGSGVKDFLNDWLKAL